MIVHVTSVIHVHEVLWMSYKHLWNMNDLIILIKVVELSTKTGKKYMHSVFLSGAVGLVAFGVTIFSTCII